MSQRSEKRRGLKRDTGPADVSTARESREDIRTGTSAVALKQGILDNLWYVQGTIPELATQNDWYMAVACSVRDRMVEHFIRWMKELKRPEVKMASYLSAEFLMGPHLGNNLLNMGLTDCVREALEELGLDLDIILELEVEPGLGNG